MSCDITTGRLDSGCLDSIGGVKNIHFANFNKDLKSSLVDGSGVVTSVPIFKYELRGTNNIDESNTKDINAGTSIFETSGTITFKKQDNDTRSQMILLSKGRPHIIAEGYDGMFKLYGVENGIDISVNTASGADLNEFNGYTLTLAGKESELALFLNEATIGASGDGTLFEVQ